MCADTKNKSLELDFGIDNQYKSCDPRERAQRVYAEIDLEAILHNMEAMHEIISADTKMMAVVKADGYGHGAVPIAKVIENLPYLYGFGVATIEEGLSLRKSGIKKPILILGYVFPGRYEELVEADLMPTVFTWEMAADLEQTAARLKQKCRIHFAVDTGMSRIGYQADAQSVEEMTRIAEFAHIIVEGIFTHFARADETDKTYAKEQLEKFLDITEQIEKKGLAIPVRHCSNSAGILELPEANLNMVRAGVTLYGLWPSPQVDQSRLSIRPAMSLKSHIACLKELPKGRAVSYGGTYITKGTERIATIPIGYADGYARGLSGNGEVLIHGMRAPICGRICMDQFMVDVTKIPNAAVGDEVTLIGGDGGGRISIEELGERSGRFNYEFACCIGKRVPRIYRKEDMILGEEDFGSE